MARAADAACRIGGVAQTEPRVDEQQAVAGLDEQHVADQPAGRQRGPHGAAVEVVDPHRPPPFPIRRIRCRESYAL
ncbi:hypothetical protein Aph02nite_89410 [Actinoplanes philippinensis]|nr:hypothetical protein Aph02nite_89410 [Actinoplanes philippinensis]